MSTFLQIKWSVSRGRDTYGYNIVTLTDTATGKRYRCNGGGYDMIGTVFGEWLQTEYQSELMAIKDRAHESYSAGSLVPGLPGERYDVPATLEHRGFYGMRYLDRTNRVSLDGACGLESMKAIAEAIGLSVQWVGASRGKTLGYMVTESE